MEGERTPKKTKKESETKPKILLVATVSVNQRINRHSLLLGSPVSPLRPIEWVRHNIEIGVRPETVLRQLVGRSFQMVW